MYSIWTLAGLAALLTLSACGGGGGGNSGGNPGSGNVLFVADIGHNTVAAFPDLNPPAGSVVSGDTFSVSLLGPSLAYKADTDELYVASGGSVAVYSNASRAKGSPLPARTITVPGVDLVGTPVIYLDKIQDVLYVGGARAYDGAIVAINHASTASGSVIPNRTMTIGDGVNFFTVDPTHSVLYVLNSLSGVHVYQNVNTANGAITQSHAWSGAGTGLAVDPALDRLYVSDPSSGVRVVNQASTSSGYPAGTLAIPSAKYVTLDATNDRLYIGAYTSAYIVNSASSLGLGSSVPAALTLAPAGSSIAGFAFP
jgi:hypothetical protein